MRNSVSVEERASEKEPAVLNKIFIYFKTSNEYMVENCVPLDYIKSSWNVKSIFERKLDKLDVMKMKSFCSEKTFNLVFQNKRIFSDIEHNISNCIILLVSATVRFAS